MTLTIQLPSDAEARIAEKARRAGVDVTTYVQRVLQVDATRPSLDELLKPVRDAFEESGMSEEQLSALLVTAKKQMRADRRDSKQP